MVVDGAGAAPHTAMGPTFVLCRLTRPTVDDPKRRVRIERDSARDPVGEGEDSMGLAVFPAPNASVLTAVTASLSRDGWIGH